jgi:hypothetical protein
MIECMLEMVLGSAGIRIPYVCKQEDFVVLIYMC